MSRILILGATGYIGSNLANSLVRSGQYRVYGVARSPEKAKQLSLCLDPVNDPASYLDVIRNAHIDILVDVAGAGRGSHKFLEHIMQVGHERLNAYKKAGIRGPKLGLIYCSGTWVHGSSERVVSDLDMVGPEASIPPRAMVAWRVGLGKAIRKATDVLDVAIIRPALIYGRELRIWSKFFAPLLEAVTAGSQEELTFPLDSHARPGLIHVDDVSCFQKAIERFSLLAGSGNAVYPVLDFVTSQESMTEVFTAVAASYSFKGSVILSGNGGDLFNEAMSTTFNGFFEPR
ncbi:hypothetical protein H2200_007252 [Cladophialophora chaetospira]|uniref:NAD-dependent epimerase/dehydratase domain-containing protein n=1 Tax=Cladophialophora chaetospira TaxID=386627 RepID=A0AA39CHA9_9EURO|nr:hypothetical protein H2200_007252 [Cladophialophora chaetospira]